MKKIIGVLALASFMTGCLSYVEEVKDGPYIEKATVTMRPLRVLVSMDGGGNESSPAFQLSGYLQSNLEGVLAQRGYRVVYDRPSEILVSTCGPVTCQLLNQRGSRVVYRGDVDIQVTREPFVNKMKGKDGNGETMKDIVARRRFDMKGSESRGKPDHSDGIKSVADNASPQLTKWVANSVSQIAASLATCEFTVGNAWLYHGEEDYPSRLVRTLNAMDGIYNCRVISTDNLKRSVRVEVIYERDMFPEGLVNALYTVRDLKLYR